MKEKFTFLLSIAAIVISGVAICFVLFRAEPVNIDPLGFFGWTTTALSVIVMLLIGWNIYSLIDLNRHKKELEDLKNDMEKRVLSIEKSIKDKISFETIGLVSLLMSINTKGIKESIVEAFKQFSDYKGTGSFVELLAREHILQSLKVLAVDEDAKTKMIDYLSKNVPPKQVEAYYLDFVSYTPKQKPPLQDDLKLLLIELQKATIQWESRS